MSQISFADAEYAGKRKKTRREVFLEEMELVVPWKVLLKIIEPHYPVAGRGRRPSAGVDEQTKAIIVDFFDRLFARHHVAVRTPQ
jgi:hypothetical protein